MKAWPNDDEVCAAAADLIARFEGFRAKPYLCPAGKWTVGYGTTRYPDGRPIADGDPPISRATAESYLRAELTRQLLSLPRILHRAPSAPQCAAMLSLIYNIGAGRFAKSSVPEAFNADDNARAADAFLLYDKTHVGGKLTVLSGLKARREAERALYLKG